MLTDFGQINSNKIEENNHQRKLNWRDLLIVVLAGLIGFLGGLTAWLCLVPEEVDMDNEILLIEREPEIIKEESFYYLPQTTHEEKIIQAASQSLPGVVTIMVSRQVTFDSFYGMEWFFGSPQPITQEEISYGTGFFVSSDGLILTNKHVVPEGEIECQITTNDNQVYEAEVLARDPIYDLALLQIEGSGFPVLELGDSDKLVPGQTVLAIGNALGQFEGTVSTGIVSGLSRVISAYGAGYSDTLDDLIQTDAAINRGNSGGPLLDLSGKVIGVNVAVAEQAQNVGFAIPINQAKRAIRSVQETGRIVYPFLGISYVMVDAEVQEEKDLPYDYGALIVEEMSTGRAIVPGSAAEDMGLQTGDLILEFNGQKITADNMLNRIIQECDPGDQIVLIVWRNGQALTLTGKLGQRDS